MNPLPYRPLGVSQADELERFKRDINLTEFAASYGYWRVERDRAAGCPWSRSTAASASMRQPTTDDKIVIRRDRDGHWTYFSVRDESDNGTVIDFVQRRRPGGLGGVHKELRAWLREDRPHLAVQLSHSAIPMHGRDERAVRAAFDRARLGRSSYLAERSIATAVQRDLRFRSNYRVDARGKVLFPHCDPSTGQVVGFEVKGRGYTAFATGGRKTFWMSSASPDDDRLVILEGSIDALSYHQLFPHPRVRYLSTGGSLGSAQLALVAAAIAAMPVGADIVIGTDADSAGDKLHERLLAVVDRPLRRHRPPVPKDWNDYLGSLERTRGRRRESDLAR